MRQLFLIVSVHLFLFLVLFAYHAQAADEEWTIDRLETLSFARVSGEVTHGDNLNFWIRTQDNCETVYNTFTVSPYEKLWDIKQLLYKIILIKEDLNPFFQNKTQ